MRVFLLKEEDFDRLRLTIDRNPEHGLNGGSSQVFSETEKEAQLEAHRFYNYQVVRWIESVRK